MEFDYQMALVLQHQLNREEDDHEATDALLAKILQESEEPPPTSPTTKNTLNTLNSSKCLTDPTWELVDPTPDIYAMFMGFNERFFWNKLLTVCVSWSKRMTTCAGICSYQGRGGLCAITLSEPLLKLRPRKDLVETLLHEMIHAYLFVTDNNKDRDGHGPEFHKHMHRINKETGTNITVYHDFHDEVRLYQKHWWRCDGPCRDRKPYFGMVKRATNRAPGAYDNWWAEHARTCGGTFIKVKEPTPEPKKSKKEPKTNKKLPDIRKYLNDTASDDNVINSKDFDKSRTKGNIGSNNVKGFNDFKQPSATVTSGATSFIDNSVANNIKGFGNLNKSNNPFNSAPPGTSKGYVLNDSKPKDNVTGFKDLKQVQTKGARSNATSTIVITKTKTNTTPADIYTPTVVSKPEEVINTNTDSTTAFLNVRNHWRNKYPKRPTTSPPSVEIRTKIPKLSETPPEMTECPVCHKQVLMATLNDHLDLCLLGDDLNDNTNETAVSNNPDSIIDRKSRVKTDEDLSNNPKVKTSDKDTRGKDKCPICKSSIVSDTFNAHLEQCLLNLYDDAGVNDGTEKENVAGNIDDSEKNEGDDEVSCLYCGIKVRKSDLDRHLEDCMSDFFVKNSGGSAPKVYNCPYCMKLISEAEMSAHIDVCLETTEGKNVLQELFNDDRDGFSV